MKIGNHITRSSKPTKTLSQKLLTLPFRVAATFSPILPVGQNRFCGLTHCYADTRTGVQKGEKNGTSNLAEKQNRS